MYIMISFQVEPKQLYHADTYTEQLKFLINLLISFLEMLVTPNMFMNMPEHVQCPDTTLIFNLLFHHNHQAVIF